MPNTRACAARAGADWEVSARLVLFSFAEMVAVLDCANLPSGNRIQIMRSR
jgi:hypothetical protein